MSTSGPSSSKTPAVMQSELMASEADSKRMKLEGEKSQDTEQRSSNVICETDRLEPADPIVMNGWWADELVKVEKSFSSFTKKPYFVNKFGFINVIFNCLVKGEAIFMPTGCCKTFMAISLDAFCSHSLSSSEREEVKKHYSGIVKDDIIDEHEGKYTVFRLSFRHFPYYANQSFDSTFIDFLTEHLGEPYEEFFRNVDPNEVNGRSLPLFIRLIDWIYKGNDKRRIIIIIDEVDNISNKYVQKGASDALTDDMQTNLKNILTSAVSNSRVQKVIIFGIHHPFGILQSRSWRKFDLCCEEECVQYFMFTSEDVQHVLKKYELSEHFNTVKECYGNYMNKYFCPASVIAFVNNKGQRLSYKQCRRSCDILGVELKSKDTLLLPFIQKDGSHVHIALDNIYYRAPLDSCEPIFQFMYAGLLTSTDLTSMECLSGKYHFLAGNLENINIIFKFLYGATKPDPEKREEILRRVEEALNYVNFGKLSKALNEILNLSIEMNCERNFQNIIKFVFFLMDGWDSTTEVDHLVNRLANKTLKYLYVFKLKYIKASEVAKDINEVEEVADRALQEITDKGYITPADRQAGFVKIMEVAMVCQGKVVTIKSRRHAPPTAKLQLGEN